MFFPTCEMNPTNSNCPDRCLPSSISRFIASSNNPLLSSCLLLRGNRSKIKKPRSDNVADLSNADFFLVVVASTNQHRLSDPRTTNNTTYPDIDAAAINCGNSSWWPNNHITAASGEAALPGCCGGGGGGCIVFVGFVVDIVEKVNETKTFSTIGYRQQSPQ